MFGDGTRFVEFLTETDSQRRIERAKDIFLYLAFTVPFSIPNWFLSNLLEFETKAPRLSGKYVPQDHFVHSIYVYLLGIYFFSYHRGLYSEQINYFSHIRRLPREGKPLRRSNMEPAATDFIYCWKLFCLCHDVGYPWEREMPASGSKDATTDFRHPFYVTREAIAKDASLRGLSNLLALSLLSRDDRPDRFEHADARHIDVKGWQLVRSNEDNAIAPNSGLSALDVVRVIQTRDDWVALPRVSGEAYARTVSSIFSGERIMAVLESKTEDRPLAVVASVDGTLQVVSRSNTFRNRDALIDYAFAYGSGPSTGQSWRYYVDNPKRSRNEFLANSVGGRVVEFFDDVLADLSQSIKLNLSMVNTETEFNDLAFSVYRTFLKSFLYLNDSDQTRDGAPRPELAKKLELLQRIKQNVASESIELVMETVRSTMTQAISNAGSEIWKRGSEEIVAAFVGDFGSPNKMQAAVREVVGPFIQSRIQHEGARVEVYSGVRTTVMSALPQQAIFKRGQEIAVNDFDDPVLNRVCDLARQSGLWTRSADTCSEVISHFVGYKPVWVDKLDHGVASALVMLECNRSARTALRSIDPEDQEAKSRLVQLALGTSNLSTVYKVDHDLNDLYPEAIFAALVHNLYPQEMGEEFSSFKVSLNRSPFLFFSMLVDVLQPWDREKYFDLSQRDLPPKLTADTYDILVRGNLFNVYLGGDDLSLASLDEKFRKDLDTYLEGASGLIRLSLAEWR